MTSRIQENATSGVTLAAAFARDAADPLAPVRERLDIPPEVIYLDGNSLGVLPKGVAERVAKSVASEWGTGLIRSWNAAGWIDLPRHVGARIAPLVGAEPDCVVAADSTTVNLFKVVSAAVSLRPERTKIVTETRNFPTDNYIAEGVIRQCGDRHRLVHVDRPQEIAAALDDDTAVLMLTHVNYRDGSLHDMAALTRAAHDAGALVAWDLAPSAGALVVAAVALVLELLAAAAQRAVTPAGTRGTSGGRGWRSSPNREPEGEGPLSTPSPTVNT